MTFLEARIAAVKNENGLLRAKASVVEKKVMEKDNDLKRAREDLLEAEKRFQYVEGAQKKKRRTEVDTNRGFSDVLDETGDDVDLCVVLRVLGTLEVLLGQEAELSEAVKHLKMVKEEVNKFSGEAREQLLSNGNGRITTPIED